MRGSADALCIGPPTPGASHLCSAMDPPHAPLPKKWEWKATQRVGDLPKVIQPAEASLGCDCFWPMSTSPQHPNLPQLGRPGRPSAFSVPASLLCGRSAQPLLTHCHDGELVAGFWLFVSLHLLSPSTT